jgi:hyperosmotically inducible periplasmic protein
MKKLSLLMIVFCALAFYGIVGFTGCTAAKNTGTAVSEGTKEAAEKTGEVVTDASITAAVKMKMADDEMVKARNIDVDTKDGVVTLNGTVSSKAEEQKAIDLANSVDGVKRVVSNLRVSS